MVKQSSKLHLGCGFTILPDWINVDCVANPGVDLVFDLNNCDKESLPLEDNSIERIMAVHLIEHISKPLPLMQELYRVAKPDAEMICYVPYGASDDAFEDPTHIRPYFLNSFSYFSQPYYWRANYGYTGDWKPETIRLKISSAKYSGKLVQDIMADIMNLRNIVSEMCVVMRAIKPAREPKRELQVRPNILFDFI
ncbi:class I SAM-dependent methyltransferase [Dendrosporobacter sp. 1207_IL3150]|uniref:class I SAM-dependent methyltransferase n=1 Tax=Dendrosporobacter sp. 1207_IL3150 TaxID=3084054 RepID=UPI002FD99FF3